MSSMMQSVAICTVASFLVMGCGDNKESATQPSFSSAKLKKSDSDSVLLNQLRSTLLKQYGTASETHYYPTASPSDTASTAINATSSTNPQERGVDEEDRLKTDGQYLYASSVDKPSLLVFKPDAATAPPVASLDLVTHNNTLLSGLYLHNQTAIALAKDRFYGWGSWLTPAMDMMFMPVNTHPSSQLFFIDISQPESPKALNSLSIDGQLISSRLVGSMLYVSLRYTPNLKSLIPYPTTEAQAAANRSLIDNASLKDLMPNYTLGQNTAELFSEQQSCLQTQYSKDSSSNTIISLLAIDVSSANPIPKGLCFIGDAETLYASPTAIYLATTQYNYTATANTLVTYNGTVQTDIHKFALTEGVISYKASGRIGGHLGWYQDLKPFRLSEHNDVLRVISFTGDQASTTASTAKLYTLKENSSTQNLDIIGTLPNSSNPQSLGKIGEQIYATRFVGDRAYLVTYRLTDPLYILDLSNPTNPTMLSELEIEGYSDYLHPVGDHYLLGVGKDAVITETGRGDSGRSAFYQGVKLSLIDISNPTQPFEKDKIILGKRGSNTAVSQTHHAFTSLQTSNTLRAALPISLHDTPAPNEQNVPEAMRYYNWTRDELVRFSIDIEQGSLTQLPAVIGETAGSKTYSTSWDEDRSIIMGGYIHYLHQDKVISTAW